jgi:uncharacterized membrane protein
MFFYVLMVRWFRVKETRSVYNKRNFEILLFFVFLLIPVFVLSISTGRMDDFYMHPIIVFVALLAMLLTNNIEIPILYDVKTRKPSYSPQEIDLISEMYSVPVGAELSTGKERVYDSTITLNLGGFIIPLVLAAYVMSVIYTLNDSVQLQSIIITLSIMVIVTHLFSEVKSGVGIIVPEYISLLTVPIAFVVSLEKPATIILVSGILGILIGIITSLVAMKRGEKGSAFFNLGGGGNFNAVYIAVLLSVFVSFLK